MAFEAGIDSLQLLGAGLLGLSAGVVVALVRPHDSSLSGSLRGFAFSALLWAVGDVLASNAATLLWKHVGLSVLYTGSIFLPPLWWSLAVRWAEDRGVRLAPDPHLWARLPLLFAGVLWVGMITNPLHGQFIVPVIGGRNQYGPLWWCMAIPNYCLILAALALELRVLRRGVPTNRRQSAFLIAASISMLVANLVYVSGLRAGVNVTLLVLAVSAVILTVGMMREGLFGALPVAFPLIASNDPDGLVVLHPAGGVLYTNRSAREVLSPVVPALEAPLLAFLGPRLLAVDGAPIEDFGPGWEEHWWGEVLEPGGALYRYAAEGERWLRISAQPIHGRQHRLLAYSLRIHDATREQRAESEARRARRLESVGELAAGVAHDFNNLLMVMRGNAALLADVLPASPELQRKLRRIESAGDEAIALAKQLQLYAGASEPRRQPLDLTKLARATLGALGPDIFSVPGGALPDVRLDLRPTPAMIDADAVQLRQILLNLLVNARDALEGEGGQIRVSTGCTRLDPGRLHRLVEGKAEPARDYAYLRVADTGCGMGPSTLERIFEPYFSTKGKQRGIGLSTVFGIVRSHDALLELESAKGSGTTFTVYFPVVSAEEIGRGD